MPTNTAPPASAERDFPLGLPDFHYQDLHDEGRLADLDAAFLSALEAEDPEIARRLRAYRGAPGSFDPLSRSRLLVDAARPLGRFVAVLFGVEREWQRQIEVAQPDAVLFRFRRDFLQRRAVKAPLPDLAAADAEAIARMGHAIERGLHPELPWEADPELATSRVGTSLLDLEADFIAALRQKKIPEVPPAARARAIALAAGAARLGLTSPGEAIPPPSEGDEGLLTFLDALLKAYAVWTHARMRHPLWSREIRGWASFRLPHTLDYSALVATARPNSALPEERVGPLEHRRRRQGFLLTDSRMDQREVLGETHYCLLCHEREKDSCSKGFFDNKTDTFQKNPLGVPLPGCPLDEKISEMHALRRDGDSIGALALVCIDNPMCPGTGHRICNDCMKGCIFQKQDPVNIPQIETGVLTDVLSLPWGVEIYGLFTRWNPLSPPRPYAVPYNGRKVLVVGLGPAGYTLAHYLLNEGFGVVGIDGLKIEPLPADWTGSDGLGVRPIRDWSEIERPLDRRPLAGFGGVSEYGITVRWDKNFL
ncbi:MAG: pyridine nucleotide-disulfide oxidoreductase, partial [Acidobacteriota bacterium]